MSDTDDTPDLPDPFRPNWVWNVFDFLLTCFFTLWLRLRARGRENLPADSGALLLINHQSFLDPLLVGSGLRRPVSYLARDSLFRVPFIGWVLRNTYVIPISRTATTTGPLKEATRRMQHGFLVGIFPEGTRTRDGNMGPVKPGFIALVRRAKVPVIPVGIAGAHAAFPRNSILVRPKTVRVVIGEPFSYEEIAHLTQKGNEDQFVDRARERISACVEAADQWIKGTAEDEPDADRSAKSS